jgi:hypothetical protein
MVKFHEEPVLYRKVGSARSAISVTDRVFDCHNSQITSQLMPFIRPSERREGFLLKWYSEPQEFRPIRD